MMIIWRAFIFSLVLAAGVMPGRAAAWTWRTENSGAWSDASNWGGTLPPTDGTADIIFSKIGVPFKTRGSTTLDQDWNVNSISWNPVSLDGGLSYIQKPGASTTLTLQSGGLTNASGGRVEIYPNLILAVPQRWDDSSISITIYGMVSGAGGIEKTGTGTLLLTSTSNTYGGGTVVSGGILQVYGSGALGDAAGSVQVNGGTLRIGAFPLSQSTISFPQAFVFSGTGSIEARLANVSFDGPLSGPGQMSLETDLSWGVFLQSRFTLSGSNSYSGGTVVGAVTVYATGTSDALGAGNVTLKNGAVLSLNSPTNLAPGAQIVMQPGSVLAAASPGFDPAVFVHPTNTTGGTIALSGTRTAPIDLAAIGNGELFLGASGSNIVYAANALGVGAGGIYRIGGGFTAQPSASPQLTFAGTDNLFTGTNAVVIGSSHGLQGGDARSGGTVVLQNRNDYSGGTRIFAGTLEIGNNEALGSGTLTVLGGGLSFQDSVRLVANPWALDTSNSGSWLSISGTNDLVFTGPVNLGGGYRVLFGRGMGTAVFANTISSGTFTLVGGRLELSGTNTCSLRVVDSGIVDASSDANLGAAGVPLTLLQGSVRALKSFTITRPIAITGYRSGGFLTNGHTVTLTGPTTDASGILTKGEPGTLILSGSASLRAGLAVNGGKVVLDRSGSNDSFGVSVNSGGTLAGAGAIGYTSVSAFGHLAPGDEIPGTLVFNSSLLLGGGGAIFDFDLGPLGSDKIVFIHGAPMIQRGTVTVNISDAGGLQSGQTYTLVDWSMSDSPTGALTSGSTFRIGSSPLPGTFSVVNKTLQFTTAPIMTFTVNSTADIGAGSLREAIVAANGAGYGVVDLTGISGEVNLDSPLPDLTASVSLKGSGVNNLALRRSETLPDGSTTPAFRIFTIAAGATVTMSDLAIENGLSQQGAGILNNGRLTLRRVLVTGNNASDAALSAAGGGIYNAATLLMSESTISANTATGISTPAVAGGRGGGIYTADVFNRSAHTTLRNCTISGNMAKGLADENGFASARGGGAASEGRSVSLFNCTVSGNSAESEELPGNAHSSTAFGGGVFGGGTLVNCTVADNVARGGIADFGGADDIDGLNCLLAENSLVSSNAGSETRYFDAPLDSLHHCIVTRETTGSTFAIMTDAEGNQIGSEADPIDVHLQPLSDSGGPTLTRAIFPDSPAYDMGDDAVLRALYGLATDQRVSGARKVGAHVDIGAFEFDETTSHGLVRFTSSNYTATEGAAAATISLERIFGSAGRLLVHYVAGEGSATPDVNYTAVSGDLAFGAGETMKSFDVPVLEDDQEEGPTTVGLTLGDALNGNANLGHATLTIEDNDAVIPTVTISQPADGIRVTEGQVTLTGSAADNVAVKKVQVQVDDGQFTDATGTNSWSIEVSLNTPGIHTIRVKSIDSFNSESAPAVVHVERVIYSSLSVAIEGIGTVSAGFAGTTTRELGKPYLVTATPGAGRFFEGWRDGGEFLSHNPTLEFTMEENLSLTAVFIAKPFRSLRGDYSGVSASGRPGRLSLTTTAAGTFTGKLTVDGATYMVRGSFGNDSFASISIPREGQPSLGLTLYLDVENAANGAAVVATISDGVDTFNITAGRSPWKKHGNPLPAEFVGKFTLLLPAGSTASGAGFPAGDGWATLTSSKAGTVVLQGSLADGTKISYGSSVFSDASWPLYIPLYNQAGSISGIVSFSGNGKLDGTLRWFRPAGGNGELFAAGFPVSGASPVILAQGARYEARAKNTSVSARLKFSGGNFSPFEQSVTLGSMKHGAKVVTPNPNGVSLTFDRETGRFSGTFIHPMSHAMVPFSGTILGASGSGAGFFLGATETGRVEITAQP